MSKIAAQNVDGKAKELPIYAVYLNPTDYPGKFIVRRWINNIPDKEPLIITPLLSKVRDKMEAMGLQNISRFEDDDPKILECWI